MNRKILIIAGLCFMFCLFSGCQEEDMIERDYPLLKTLAVDNITGDNVRFSALITAGSVENITEYGFVWAESFVLTLANSEKVIISGSPPAENFYCDVTYAFEPQNVYYVRSFIISDGLIIYGNMVQFRRLKSSITVNKIL